MKALFAKGDGKGLIRRISALRKGVFGRTRIVERGAVLLDEERPDERQQQAQGQPLAPPR